MLIVITVEQAMLDIDTVAKQLSVSTATVRRLAKSGQLRGYRILGQYRFKQEDVNSYLNSALIKPDREEESSKEETKLEED